MQNSLQSPYRRDPAASPWLDSLVHWLTEGPDETETGRSEEISGRKGGTPGKAGGVDTRSILSSFSPPESFEWAIELGEEILEAIGRGRASLNSMQREQFIKRLRILLPKHSEWSLRLLFEAAANDDETTDLLVADQAARIYQNVYTWQLSLCEGQVLQTIAWNRRSAPLKLLVELLVKYPPHDWSATALAISPLMRSKEWDVCSVFPKILEGFQHPTVVAPVLDLANYVVRSEMTSRHPAEEHKHQLVEVLGGVVSRMGVMEENPSRFGDSVSKIQNVLSESVALCVSLCDALSWMNDPSVIGKLNQAMSLQHRRVQTEAAAALTRLGDSDGKRKLLEFAADPATRIRAIQYARELGLEDEIDEQWLMPVSVAESELAVWLSQAPQMGLAPTHIELVDQRSQYWPGYDAPQECFLFRYGYRFPDCEISNIGIAGPMLHSFAADIGDLSEDDIYAAFAGWCAEHDDIYEVSSEHWNGSQQYEVKRFVQHLEKEGYEEIAPLFLGFFLGERSLTVRCQREGTDGIATTDGLELLWFPTNRSVRPLGPVEVYSIYKGRKILRTFNG